MKRHTLFLAEHFPFAIRNLLSLILLLGFYFQTLAQVDVVATGGTMNASYTTLSAAFAAINGGTHTGTITINITGNTSEPVTGAVLNGSGTGSANYGSILVKPSGGATRTISGAATAGMPLIDLNGADNVTFDGINSGGNSLTIENTTVSATSGTSTIRFQADATNNLLTNCSINGASTMATGTNGGNIWFGAGSSVTGNDNNTIYKCKIGPSGSNFPAKGIYGNGTGTNTTLYNSNITIDNNEIYDYWNATVQSNGIYMTSACSDWIITNNKFYQTGTRSQTTAAANVAIQLASANIENTVITNNTIGYSNAGGTGVYTLSSTVATTFVGISVSTGTATATSIQGNTISNISLTTSSGTSTGSGILCGIALLAGSANVGNITGNTIGSGTGLASLVATPSTSTGAIVGINAGTTGAVIIQNNTIGGFQSIGSTAAIASAVFGINISAASANISVTNNTIGNSVANNMVAGTLGTTTGATIAMGINASTVPTVTNLSNNTIQNISSFGSGTGNARGIFTSTTTNTTSSYTISNNTIKNITTNSSLTGQTSGLTAGTGIQYFPGLNGTVSNNTISNIAGLNTGLVNTVITGIALANAASPFIYGNRIYDITNASTATSTTAPGVAAGITIRSGNNNFTIYNNMISLGNGQTTNTAFIGIYANHGSSPNPNDNIYFNTVNITGVAASGAQPSFCFYRGDFSATARTMNVDIKSNIFTNNRTGGTGAHFAIANNYGATVSATGWPAGASNYNVLNANPATIGWWGSNQTFAGWKTASSCDANSYSGISVVYTNLANDLHLNMGMTPTVIESGGTAIAGITNDYDAQVRPGPAGSMNGGGTFPDIGADEFDGVPLDLLAPLIVYSPLINACGTGNQVLSNVNIQDVSGVPTTGSLRPRIYYRKNGGSWFSQPGTLTSGTDKNGQWMFTIVVANLGGVVIGDVIDYYVIAQDQATPTNISSNPAGVVATDVNNVTTPPPAPNTITVNPSLNGTYTVGMGGDYATLTAAAAAYNIGCLSGPVTFLLIDNSYPSETFPITFNHINATSFTPLVIKPGAGKTPVISGSSTSCIIRFNGADWITIDGSNAGGTDRSLTLNNTSTAANTAVVCVQSLGTGNGATNDIIKNCNITGGSNSAATFGVHVAGPTISSTATGDDNDDLTLQNNAIKMVLYGIYSNSSAAGQNDNMQIISNQIGSTVTAEQVGQYGMLLAQLNNATIKKNEVFNIIGTSTNPTGIRLNAGTVNSQITQNKIHDLSYTGTSGFGGKGIDIASSASSNLTVANNFIWNLTGDGWSTITSDAIVGIRLLSPTTGVNVYHNTVNLTGSISRSSATADVSAAFYAHSTAALLNVKNNIFINKLENTTGVATAFAIFTDVAGTGYTSLNNNNYFVAGPEGVLGRIATTTYATLASWQTAIGTDFLSRSVDPLFVSTNDLHLQTNAQNNCLNQGGMPLSVVTVDIDDEVRSKTNPDIGADEFNGVSNATIVVTETSGTINDKKICLGASATITVNGAVSHKWNTGDVTSSIVVSPGTTSMYYDTINIVSGCPVVMFDTITVLSVPMASITPPSASICEGTSVSLTANGGGTYLWNTGSTSSTINVSPASTTTYTVTVTGGNGCTAIASATVTVNSKPVPVITPASATICSGTSQTLMASGGISYLWDNGSTNPIRTVTPASTTTYTVTVTAANGCTDTKTATVTVLTGVSISETIVQPTSCFSLDGSINLTVGGVSPFTYNWTTPDGIGLVNGQEDQSGLSVGSYFVTVTSSGNGCSATKFYSLTGPGNCGTCPTMGSLSKSVSTVCKTTTFTLTASGLAGMGTLYGVLFKYSTTPLADPYMGGTTLGTVTNANLGNGGTTATLNASIPLQGDYYLYAILTPTPVNPSCRPSVSNDIKVLKCTPEITDPCSCKNNATTLTNGQFNETITVNAPSGQVWTIQNNVGLYQSSSPAPPSPPNLINNGTAMTEQVLGGGVSNYILSGIHVDALGYSASFTNGNISLPIGNTCYYPNPSIVGLASTFCANDPAVTLVGAAQLGDGSGPAMGTGSFTINGNAATTFNPAVVGPGTHTVSYTFDAADGVPNPSHPGCTQSVSQTVVVNPVPSVNGVADRSLCVGQTSATITFTGTPTGAVFNWTRTPEAIGLAVTSGTGSVPSFTATNAGNTPLTSVFTVTPQYTNAGKTCTGTPITFSITVNPTPNVNTVPDVQYCHGDVTAVINFSGNAAGSVFNWTRTPENIGLAALNGTGSVPSFVATNTGATRLTSTFTVTPVFTNRGATCAGAPINFRLSVLPQPIARCKNATIYLDHNGRANLTTADIDNGSTAYSLSLSKSTFDCGNTGPNNVILTARDSCGKSSSCSAVVTVLDTIDPVFWCPKDWTVNLDPGECNRAISFDEPEATDNCTLVASTANGSITTTFASNNQFAGNMFNLTNVSTGVITLNSFAGNISAAVGTNVIVEVYYTPTTYVGKETNPAAWTLLGTANAPCAGLNQPTLFNIGGLSINPGESYGIYFNLVNYTAGSIVLRYTNGTNTYNNGDLSLFAGVGKANPAFTGTTFASRIWNGTIQYTKRIVVGGDPKVTQIDNSGYKNGDFFPRGTTCLTYQATDFSGNTALCSFCITLSEYANPNTELVCNDEIQVSLNENCTATIGADEILSGGPYRCFDDYRIIIQDWVTGQVIDRNSSLRGSQVGFQDIGRELKITVIDTVTGNSCWGHATVEDKIAPQLVCARDTCVPCGTTALTPFYMGTPSVTENCSGYSLTYSDRVEQGGCALGFEQKITRTWKVSDGSGNVNQCIQVITVALATLATVDVPLNFDDLEEPALACDEKINTTKDYSAHYLPYPYCVDGYLLDSAHWFATGGFLPSPNGDLAGERLPRALGWNSIDTGLYIGHPSPWPIHWPAHPNWRPNNPVCWGPDEIIMWYGTGYPTGYACSNLGITFQDVRIDVAKPGCDAGDVGCFKIVRQWTVMDWCTSEVGGHNQIIKVIDKHGPQILYPDTAIVNMDPWNCLGIWEVPKPWLLDNCSNEIHYSVEISSGVVTGNETDGYVIVNIERGLNEAYIVAEDCCGNISKKRVAVNVPDNTPPVAVCDQRTVVSLTGNQTQNENFGKVFAKDLDQGSFDNCAPHVFFKVIRMEHLRGTNNGSNANQFDTGINCATVNGDDNAILDGNQIYFDDHVKFCCSDVGKTIMVVFRVFDVETGDGPITPSRMNPGGPLFNHFTDCMVEIEVQDKSVPTVVAPPNIVVSCWFWFDVEDLSDPNDATFGRVVNDLTARRKVITKDLVCYNYCVRNDITGYPGYVPGAPPSNPPAWNRACQFYQELFDTAHADRKHELVWGFDGTVLGTCGTNFSISVNDNRECGQGQLTRTVVARGPNGVSVTATQTIWVVDCDPFYINREDNCDPDDDITWPGNCTGQATTIEGCGADISPDNPLLGRPTVENGADDLCALISIEHFDEIFTIEPDACFKVLRKWVVIDWCQYDPSLDSERGRWEYLQIIKVHDNDKPEVAIAFSDFCQPAVKNPVDNLCYAPVIITVGATDNCSPEDWLFYEYKIDLYNDGKGEHSGYDFAVGPLTRKEFAAGRRPLKNHNPLANDPNNPFEATGSYPLGIHKFCWFVEDGCGNIAQKCELFEVTDCKAPTPYCHVGTIITVMPSTGCITVWAKDFDAGSFDNCTEQGDLHIYFEPANSDSLTICCEDFKANKVDDELIIPVRICVEDQEGNKDCCETTLIVQDYQDVCPNSGSFGKITGELMTLNNDGTEKVEMELLDHHVMMKHMKTTSNGKYLFGDLPVGIAKEYVVKPNRNDDPLNGVSTADIVKIQRHILGIEALTSPYLMIAADVNQSATITAADVSEIRKLILGQTSAFSRCESWTFVPENYVFNNPQQPWNAPRQVTVPMPDAKEVKHDFVAIKMGDVTKNASGNHIQAGSTRSSGKLNFLVEEQAVQAGDLVYVDVRAEQFVNILGYQFTLNFDHQYLHLEDVQSGKLILDDQHFGKMHMDQGKLTTSWNHRTPQSFAPEDKLFTLVFRALANGKLSGLLAITSDITAAEAYDASLAMRSVDLQVQSTEGTHQTSVFELYQNNPNPFLKETTIDFRMPEAGDIKLTVYDATGKIIRVFEQSAFKGLNQIKISKESLDASGVLYYQLDAAGHTATKKMIVLNN